VNELLIWALGAASMLASAWITDRRDVRRGRGIARELAERFEARIERLEARVDAVTSRL